LNNETLLLRQIHPSWVNADGISSEAFNPSTKDNGKLSAYSGDLFTAEKSFDHYTATQDSVGVLAVTNEECVNEHLVCNLDNAPFEGHVSVDYNPHPKKTCKKVAKKLRNIAISRGWQFKDPDQTLPDLGSN
jgi:hypothetical protein